MKIFFILNFLAYQTDFLKYLNSQSFNKDPENLYKPIEYVLQLGGKRIRPILTLMASDIFSGDYKKALPAAMAIETFHNFTLVHDDIMDDAPLRRGKTTVHEKWNINTGILSGDAMLILAYQYFENYDSETFRELSQLFSKTALEVCNGQQLDIDFETKENVTIAQYIEMISLKTSVLIATSLKMGAIVAKTDKEQANHLYLFGLNLGIAFQLQDDYLDTYGDPKEFGKQLGGDIIANKKTYLYLKAIEVAGKKKRLRLKELYKKKIKDNPSKIIEVKAIFDDLKIPKLTKKLIDYYTNKSFEYLNLLLISEEDKNKLYIFGNNLMSRKI